MSRAGCSWCDGGARIRVVSGPTDYPNIMYESTSSVEDDWSRLGSPIDAATLTGRGEVPPTEAKSETSTLDIEEVMFLDDNLAAALWTEEFDERYKVCHEEKRAIEHLRSLEVGDYLRVHRRLRYFHKLKFDYFGNRMNTLCIHRLEQQYMKQGVDSLLETNLKEHKECIKEIQKRSQECEKRLPPIKTAIGVLEPPEEPGLPRVITCHPPVLMESRRRRAADLELRRQVKLIGDVEKTLPKKMEYFPFVL